MKRLFGLVLLLVCSVGCFAGGSFDGDDNTDFIVAVNLQDANATVGNHGQVDWYEYNPSTGGYNVRKIRNYDVGGFDTIAVGNLDDDIYMDLLTGGDSELIWYESRSDDTSVLVNKWSDPNGNYKDIKFFGNAAYVCKKGALLKITCSANNNPDVSVLWSDPNKIINTVVPVDFDDDGKLEMLVGWAEVSDPNLGQIDLWEDSGSGWAKVLTLIYTYAGGYDFVAGDFDGDLYVDVFISKVGYPQTMWMESDGTDNGLANRGTIVYRTLQHAVLADTDGDGKNELITSEMRDTSEATEVWEATGDNTFALAWKLNVSHRSGALAVGDWDDDDQLDIIIGSKPATWGTRWSVSTADNVWSSFGNSSTIPGYYSMFISEAVMTVPPQQCGDPGTLYYDADLSGPEGVRDCVVNFYDFAVFAAQWLKESI